MALSTWLVSQLMEYVHGCASFAPMSLDHHTQLVWTLMCCTYTCMAKLAHHSCTCIVCGHTFTPQQLCNHASNLSGTSCSRLPLLSNVLCTAVPYMVPPCTTNKYNHGVWGLMCVHMSYFYWICMDFNTLPNAKRQAKL